MDEGSGIEDEGLGFRKTPMQRVRHSMMGELITELTACELSVGIHACELSNGINASLLSNGLTA